MRPAVGLQVFHAGTSRNAAGEVVANGGRVLGITALGKDIADAQSKAYKVRAKPVRAKGTPFELLL